MHQKNYGALVGFSANKEETIKPPPNTEENSKVILDSLPRTIAGSSLNVVRILNSLGSAAKLLYTVGLDLHAHDVIEALTSWSIDGFPLRVRKGTPRTIVYIPNEDPKQTKLYCDKPAYDERLIPPAISEVVEQVELCKPVYLVATGVRLDDLDLVKALFTGTGKKVFNPSFDLMKNYFSQVKVLSEGVHLLIVNHEEACAGLGKPAKEFDPKMDLIKLYSLLHVETLLITYNSNGSYFCDHTGKKLHQLSLAKEVVDPTGAGDAFLGGYLHQQLAGGSAESSMAFAAACAAAKIEKIGGSNVPTIQEVKKFINQSIQPTLI